jgi:hypothetical protein
MGCVPSKRKWLVAPVEEPLVMLWQVRHVMVGVPVNAIWKAWAPELAPLCWAVPTAWQEVQAVAETRVPACQPGVVWPPWQLTLEQVKVLAFGVDPAVPVLALKVAGTKATAPGAAGAVTLALAEL